MASYPKGSYRLLPAACVFLTTLFACGCGSQSSPAPPAAHGNPTVRTSVSMRIPNREDPTAVAVSQVEPSATAIELKAVKYPQLCQAVKDQKGRIVVLDIWGEF